MNKLQTTDKIPETPKPASFYAEQLLARIQQLEERIAALEAQPSADDIVKAISKKFSEAMNRRI